MKDHEIQRLLLEKYYEMRRQGFALPTPDDFGGKLTQEDILYCSDQLGQLGLIDWKPLREGQRIIAGMGRINAHGIKVVEGKAQASKVNSLINGSLRELMVDPNASSFKYDVAVSFAGEDRAFAEAVANGLRDAGVRVFYDDFYAAETWGKDLSVELRAVYYHSSRFCIMIISQHYLEKMWTIFEGKQAIERMIKQKGNDYILPVRLNGFAGEVPGLSGSIRYLSVSTHEPQMVVRNFVEKMNRIRKEAKLRLDAQQIAERIIAKEKANLHVDQSRPICVLVRPPHFDALDKRAELVEKIDPTQDNPHLGTFVIRCALQNMGASPALKIRITFKFPDGQTTEPWELPPMGANEKRGGEDHPLRVPIPLDDPQHGIKHSLNRTDFEKVAAMAWEIWLEYEDISGKPFCTVHHKTPLKPWVTFATS